MTDTLFDLTDSPSPRLLWMRKHGITLNYLAKHEAWEAEAPTCWTSYGDTEDEALASFAKYNNLKLWNEE